MPYQAPSKTCCSCSTTWRACPPWRPCPASEATDTAQAVLEEAAHFAGEVLAAEPARRPRARRLARWRRHHRARLQAGLPPVRRGRLAGHEPPAEYGGQGLPGLLGAATSEMLNAANLSFSLCPLLTNGAIEALLTAGSAELRERYIGPMISGKWTGTMNLTEPQAGRPGPAALAPNRKATAATASPAPRSSSPTASMIWPRTSSTWCWPACPTRRA